MDFLVAVLVRLSIDHGYDKGMWFLEAGVGRVDEPGHPKFDDPTEAQAWVQRQLDER